MAMRFEVCGHEMKSVSPSASCNPSRTLLLLPGKQQEMEHQAVRRIRRIRMSGCARAPGGTATTSALGTESPARETRHCLRLQKYLRFAACLRLPGWVLLCTHTLCASRALLHMRCSGDVPPTASAAPARTGFRPCPKFCWFNVINSQEG